MPRSGTNLPTGLDQSAAELRQRAAPFRRLAREFRDEDRRLMLEFAEELEEKARQTGCEADKD
jgi:hypothetical protein